MPGSFDSGNDGFYSKNHHDEHKEEINNERVEFEKEQQAEKQVYHDPTIDEVAEDRVSKGKTVKRDKDKILSDQDIERAKREFSPEAISKEYPDEVAITGSLLQYRIELGPDGLPVREEDENGDFHDKILLDRKTRKPVIDHQVQWDENIQYDIKRGLEAYDNLDSGKDQRQSYTSKMIIDDPAINHLFEIILEDISKEDDVNDMLIVQYPHFGLIRFSQGPNSWNNHRLLYKSSVDALITLIKYKAGLKIRKEEGRRPQINGQLQHEGINFRIATGATQYGMFMVLRRQGTNFTSLDQLDFPDEIKSDFRRALSGKDGLTIVGGPVGSGKTTLMTTGLIERLENSDAGQNIISLEKPIETPTPGIIQQEVDDDLLTWSTGIESALREMPTILRVGEVNERPAARAIVRGANSGVVALTTMHIRSALEVFETLKDYDISENEIKNALRLVIYLNRVPRLCPYCRKVKSVFNNAETNRWINNHLNDGKSGAVGNFAERNTEGCPICRKGQNDSNLFGTMGKVGIFELLRVNKPLLFVWRRYQDEDLYVLKDKLMHPDTIMIENKDAIDPRERFSKVPPQMISGLDYHPIEEDILNKIRSYDIDINTAKYLLNE